MIVILVIFSFNFAFAADDNSTDLKIDSQSDGCQASNFQNSDVLTNSSGDTQTVVTGKITKRLNGAIEYQASLQDSNGTPLKDTYVEFYLDGNYERMEDTNSKGIALVKLEVSNGHHKLAIVNDDINASKTVDINVFKVITGNKKFSTYYDSGDYYKVRIMGDNGKPIGSGKTVTFKVAGKTFTKKTDKNGYAKLKISLVPGKYTIKVIYKDYRVSNPLTVKPVLKLLSSFDKYYTPTFKYKVKFLGKDKQAKSLTLKFNKKTYKAKTDKKGIATFTLKMPKTPWKGYYIDVHYKKSVVSTTLASRLYNGRLHFTLYNGNAAYVDGSH